MNLTKLFETQAKLDEKIVKEKGLQGQDLLDKKILALQVELGELAQNWRGFKFWSEDQKARTKEFCEICCGVGVYIGDDYSVYDPCFRCNGTGLSEKNPLLEEYVDCLHFVLSIGLELKVKLPYVIGNYEAPNVTRQFSLVFEDISKLDRVIRNEYEESMIFDIYDETVRGILGLGRLLGFTWEQVEQAYYAKNKENHERQENGY